MIMDKAYNFLQFMVYKAAETNAHLPQDVARDKGHKELAEYLEEVNQR